MTYRVVGNLNDLEAIIQIGLGRVPLEAVPANLIGQMREVFAIWILEVDIFGQYDLRRRGACDCEGELSVSSIRTTARMMITDLARACSSKWTY